MLESVLHVSVHAVESFVAVNVIPTVVAKWMYGYMWSDKADHSRAPSVSTYCTDAVQDPHI